MKSFVAAAAASLIALTVPSLAWAQGPATIRGVVYSCDTGALFAGANVTIKALGGGTRIDLVTDAQGAFARVGIPPGRYLVIVAGALGGSPTAALRGASRLAAVETDDVLDMRLGSQTILTPPPSGPLKTITRATEERFAREPIPICDPALVPPAPATTDRYIIH